MKCLALLFFIPCCITAQQSDILLLQKNHRTIRRFFKGSNINFYTGEHMGVSATIDSIKRDSLFLLQYDVRANQTFGGSFVADTVAVYHIQFSFKNIYSFPAGRRKFGLITNGTLFMIGGGTYLLLNLVNTLREHDPPFGHDNLPNLLGGAGAAAVGFLLNKTQRTEYRLGKKYQLKLLPGS